MSVFTAEHKKLIAQLEQLCEQVETHLETECAKAGYGYVHVSVDWDDSGGWHRFPTGKIKIKAIVGNQRRRWWKFQPDTIDYAKVMKAIAADHEADSKRRAAEDVLHKARKASETAAKELQAAFSIDVRGTDIADKFGYTCRTWTRRRRGRCWRR